MELNKIVALEYALSVVKEIYFENYKKTVKFYLVFKNDNDLFRGSLLSWDNSSLIFPKINEDLTYFIQTDRINDTDRYAENNFAQLRFQLLRKFNTSIQNRMSEDLINNSNLLLEFLINFVQDFPIEQIYIPNAFTNYHSLSYQLDLPFKTIVKNEYEVISLLVQN